MDNIEAAVAAPELGQVETTEVGSVTEPSAPSYDYVNVEDFGDKYVKVKVDGSELDVPIKEALLKPLSELIKAALVRVSICRISEEEK